MAQQVLIKNAIFFSGDYRDKAERRNILIGADGKIAAISAGKIPVNGDTEILPADGQWVVPGFLDTHTHYDAEVLASPGLKESARHGVTTVILGSCSVSAVYSNAEDAADSFTRVEALPREVMLPLLEKEKTWDNPRDWKAYIDKLPLGINVASFVGHSDLRMKVMGIERSMREGERATPEEEQRMGQLLNDALDEGFVGLSTMDNPWDKMDGERYWSHKTPSFYASWPERRSLIRILRRRNAILQGAPNLITRVNALRYMFASTGWFRKPLKTTVITLLDLIADRYIFPVVALASSITNRIGNGDFRMQSPPCPFTVYYDGVDSVMFEEFPSGEALRHLAKELDRRNELINDPVFRETFKKEIKKQFAPKVWHRDLSLCTILEAPDPTLIGKDFYQVAEERNEHPVDTFLDLIVAYDKQIKWTTTLGNDRPEKYRELYNFPYNIISFSDAGAHLNNMAFYNFPLKMIKTVQESIDAGNPIMDMEKCIWRLTKEQADWFGLDRGHLAVGKVADLVFIDPAKLDRISENVESAVIEEFDDFPRLVNRNEGVVSKVLVNGQVIFQNDAFVPGYGQGVAYGRFLPAS